MKCFACEHEIKIETGKCPYCGFSIVRMTGDPSVFEETMRTAAEAYRNAHPENFRTYMDEKLFFQDILASYSKRDEIPDVADYKWKQMTQEDIVDYYRTCVEEEREFAEKYENARFENADLEYLCSEYRRGVVKQLEACEWFESSPDSQEKYERFELRWFSGYYDRCFAIIELARNYGIAFPEEAVEIMLDDALD